MQSQDNPDHDGDDAEQRNDFRVAAPPEFLLACAVWFRTDPGRNDRISLEQLGTPDIATRKPCDTTLRITDISTKGMGLRLRTASHHQAACVSAGSVYVYFKLHDPQGLSPSRHLPMFLEARIVKAEPRDGELAMNLHFVSIILPDPHEKSFTFFHIRQYGVTELGRWCDAINRMHMNRDAMEQTASPGLHLETLLDAIDDAQEG